MNRKNPAIIKIIPNPGRAIKTKPENAKYKNIPHPLPQPSKSLDDEL